MERLAKKKQIQQIKREKILAHYSSFSLVRSIDEAIFFFVCLLFAEFTLLRVAYINRNHYVEKKRSFFFLYPLVFRLS